MFNVEVMGTQLEFEHSLVSLSKWESIHEKPFFAWNKNDTKTEEEMISYFKCMLVSPVDKAYLVSEMSPKQQIALVEYINSSRTATTVREIQSKPGAKENVTSELIYYWMISFNIPFEAQHWHLNRLVTLVRVCGAKNSPPQKMSASAAAAKYRELNEQRRKQLGTKG